ncbi:hypothetical protein OK016_01230 [Vibrio chagasii]|nr:hypothetical protein [Vibrio chagasii]
MTTNTIDERQTKVPMAQPSLAEFPLFGGIVQSHQSITGEQKFTSSQARVSCTSRFKVTCALNQTVI